MKRTQLIFFSDRNLIATAFVAAALAAFGITSASAAQSSDGSQKQSGTSSSSSSTSSKASEGGRTFAQSAAAVGMAEVASGKLASEMAQSKEVREFAKKMVEEHEKANEKLARIASEMGIEVPKKLDSAALAKLGSLKSKSGEDFDQAYMLQQVADHRKAIAMFEKQSQSGADSALKTFASNTLPTLREHLQMAQKTVEMASLDTR